LLCLFSSYSICLKIENENEKNKKAKSKNYDIWWLRSVFADCRMYGFNLFQYQFIFITKKKKKKKKWMLFSYIEISKHKTRMLLINFFVFLSKINVFQSLLFLFLYQINKAKILIFSTFINFPLIFFSIESRNKKKWPNLLIYVYVNLERNRQDDACLFVANCFSFGFSRLNVLSCLIDECLCRINL